MPTLMFMLMMFCAGITVALQPSINARLAQKVGILESACISFAVGTVALLLVVLVSGRVGFRGAGGALWWEWTGGLLGALFVSTTIVAVPRIGTAAAMAATIAAQLMTGILLDHFGLFGLKQVPFDLKRLAGMLLLLAGAALVFRR
ncbi:DMT family transporter [Geobacter sp. DSM 9736]|uniref:DMT family transporter n=1 Tax=Geobacter sp. DSM 9736 TaxID=1277350 RepID=UPI000B506BAD|nr:DMT family transporter [Geobacter sp. DSM 9736]SNB44653.1 transporter family-2 protein [Geobacter sp. DSM 9736]